MNIKNKVFNLIKVIGSIGIKRTLIALLFFVAILGVGGSYYFYSKYRDLTANPNVEAKKETDSLASVVGELMELPKNETPTVATILDKEKLNNQPFFRTSENGDKLLAYSVAKIAILYRPSTKKIINVAPITDTQPTALEQDTEQRSLDPLRRIAYYNGTETSGLAYQAEKKVQQTYSDYKTVTVTNAAKKDYKGLVVIDLSGDHTQEAIDLATLLEGTVGNLPAGEVAPDADILVISGK